MAHYRKLYGDEIDTGFVGYVKVHTVECVPEKEFFTLVKVVSITHSHRILVRPIIADGYVEFYTDGVWVIKEA